MRPVPPADDEGASKLAQFLLLVVWLALEVVFVVLGLNGTIGNGRPEPGDLDSSRGVKACSFRGCHRASSEVVQVSIEVGTTRAPTTVTIHTSQQELPFCSQHADRARRGRWPFHLSDYLIGGFFVGILGFVPAMLISATVDSAVRKLGGRVRS